MVIQVFTDGLLGGSRRLGFNHRSRAATSWDTRSFQLNMPACCVLMLFDGFIWPQRPPSNSIDVSSMVAIKRDCMPLGTITRFFRKQGYGYITPDDNDGDYVVVIDETLSNRLVEFGEGVRVRSSTVMPPWVSRHPRWSFSNHLSEQSTAFGAMCCFWCIGASVQ